MYLTELNREDARVLELNAFGGINRKYNAQMGELAEAVNMSSDEYPLLMTRQSYDVGLFEPFALMWHNNDLDYALMPQSRVIVGDKTNHANVAASLPEEVGEFVNPVYANIGTSTVICDEINGMWVLEYDKDTGRYSYNKVQNKYEVINEVSGDYITGGNYCHVRCRYEDNTMIQGVEWAKDEETLLQIADRKDDQGNYVKANHLIAYGEKPHAECVWYRLHNDGSLEPIDFLHYEFCTLEGSMKFKEGDYVELKMSGIWGRTPNLEEELKKLDGYYDVVKIRENDEGIKFSLVLKGLIGSYGTISALIMSLGKAQKEGENTLNNKFLANGMTIERKAPENVRFICSYQNRIWANNGNNEIMCCARGNPYVWYRYEGNSLDSWAATVGGDGAFTGCINYGYPLFFKEGRMLRINGTRPSNFGYTEYSMKGIKEGCHDSAVIVNDVLYYQGMDGIYAYAGSTPQKISDKVYRGRWTEGKACRYRDKYILCVTEGEEQSVYTFDTVNGLWHREKLNGGKVRYLYPGSYLHDHEEAVTIYTEYTEAEEYIKQYTSVTGNKVDIAEGIDKTKLYAGYVITDEGYNDYTEEKPIEWEFETPELIDTCEYKYLKCIRIKCRPLEDGEFTVYRERDGEWRELGREITYGDKVYWYTRSFGVERTPSIRLKISGVGRIVIDKIILEYEEGSTEH